MVRPRDSVHHAWEIVGGTERHGRCHGNADSGDRRRLVGLTISACWARLGHHVTCIESDRERLATIRAGTVPFYEPDLQELVTDGMKRGVLGVTDAFGDAVGPAEVVFIAVGTPSLRTGEPDLSAIDAVTDALRRMSGSDRVVGIQEYDPRGDDRSDRRRASGQRAGSGGARRNSSPKDLPCPTSFTRTG